MTMLCSCELCDHFVINLQFGKYLSNKKSKLSRCHQENAFSFASTWLERVNVFFYEDNIFVSKELVFLLNNCPFV